MAYTKIGAVKTRDGENELVIYEGDRRHLRLSVIDHVLRTAAAIELGELDARAAALLLDDARIRMGWK